MKPKLDKEGGITSIALSNGKKLLAALGPPIRLELHMDPDGMDWYRTKVFYDDGSTHTFTGLGWGYNGEGPRGLATFCTDNDVPLPLSKIVALDNKTQGVSWAWPE